MQAIPWEVGYTSCAAESQHERSGLSTKRYELNNDLLK